MVSEPRGGAAFLLAQLGAHAARRFADRVASLDLTPPQSGLLRSIALEPGRSQQALATHMGTPAPRLVALIDGLEQRGLVERRRNLEDRRHYAVHLTGAGEALMDEIGRVSRAHEQALLAALDPSESDQLLDLLSRIADDQGLTPGVHPGYRNLRPVDTGTPAVREVAEDDPGDGPPGR